MDVLLYTILRVKFCYIQCNKKTIHMPFTVQLAVNDQEAGILGSSSTYLP